MKLHPLNDFILAKIQEESNKTPGGLIITQKETKGPITVEVLAIGPGKVLESGEIRPMKISVGDKILINHASGTRLEFDNQKCVMITESEVFGICTQQESA